MEFFPKWVDSPPNKLIREDVHSAELYMVRCNHLRHEPVGYQTRIVNRTYNHPCLGVLPASVGVWQPIDRQAGAPRWLLKKNNNNNNILLGAAAAQFNVEYGTFSKGPSRDTDCMFDTDTDNILMECG